MTTPSVSIVLAVRNEAATIAATIESCLDQTYDGPLEIVIADAMSTDGTRAVIEQLGTNTIAVVDNPDLWTPAGLNAAIAASTGSVIVRCDGHSVLPPGYVARALETLDATGAANVGGIQRAIGITPVQRGIAAAMSNPLGVGNATFHTGGTAGPTDTVYLGVFDRSALDDVGLFDTDLSRNQDYELNIRLRDAGYTVWFDPELEVVYRPRRSLRALWRQYHDYGRWKRRVARMHPDSLRARQVAPPVLVLGLLGATMLLATPLRVLGAGAWLGYLGALAAAGIFEAVRRRDPAGLIACPAIGVMHVAWGLGFLRGIR